MQVRPDRFVIEMTPAWGSGAIDRGVVSEGPVGTQWLGRFRALWYELRCWRNAAMPDVADAVASPQTLSDYELLRAASSSGFRIS